MKSRWSVRAKITAMMTVPLVMLVALWLFAVSITLPSALDLRGASTIADRVGEPAETMVTALQSERQLTGAFLASGRKSGQALMVEARQKTDLAVANFQRQSSSGPAQDAASDELKVALETTMKALTSLAPIRAAADGGGEPDDARNGISLIVNTTYGVFEAASNHSDAGVAAEARGVFVLSMVRELLSEEDALVGDFTTEGDYTVEDYAQMVTLVGQARLLLPYAATQLRAEQQAQYQQQLGGTPALKALQDLENRLIGTTPGTTSGIELGQWRAAFDPVNTALAKFRSDVQKLNVRHASDASDRIVWQLVGAGFVGLLAVAASVLLSVRIGRSVARRLDGLARAARDLAETRLPSVVARLRQGDQVDVAAEAPPLRLGVDEIGQVAEAFNSVRRTAVASAVEEASVRQGMNEVFLNIARRSQTLLHRQLSLLDGMERRTHEPDDLADLFRVDHLATRMRRHAEDLVILAGSTPGRGWRNPVPVIDVVRGAVSEVEDYARVQVVAIGDGAVTGRAVGDVIHLLAELLENATSYSPPHTKVQVTGQAVPNGFVVEIEDRGLGMSAEALEVANRRLAEPPVFDPGNSAQLGLFVVAQLAARHRVRVVLRASPYGGVTAVVLLPADLVVAAPELPAPVLELPAKREPEPRPEPRPEPVPLRPAERPKAELPKVEEPRTTTPGGLPKRVRQRSLAPQLQQDETVVMEAPAGRSPDELRRMMTSFQAGTARGRHEARADEDGDER
ncbi:nitrate- and nitrite sensing domain-containing protein [Dactylosporangium sp. CS-047395]|uniref:sensor histidine kinase n=1 Tax=Dactylosporangium sp. CS-047395 TaxID=3239936 RepID=UPI003D94C106